LPGGKDQAQGRGVRAEAHDRPARMADHPSRQPDPPEARRFHPLRDPVLARHQALHRRIQAVRRDHQPHLAALAPNHPDGN